MKVLVVDLDNTLFDTKARYNACLAEQGVASLDSLHGGGEEEVLGVLPVT